MKRIFSILFALVLAVSLMLVPAASVGASPGPGIVGLWHLDEGIGPTAADSSGYGNDGTLSGGKFGNALDFDGTDDYVTVTDDPSLDPGDNLTVEAWIYLDSLVTTPVILSNAFATANNGGYQFLVQSDGDIRLILRKDGGTNAQTTNNQPVQTGGWHHIAAVYDSSTQNVDLYYDGVEQSSTTDHGAIPTSVSPATQDMRIGATGHDTPRQYFDGKMDEVRISDVARYTAPTFTVPTAPFDPATLNTIALWHFDEGSEQTAFDATANDNDGQLGSTTGIDANDPTWPNLPTWVPGKFGKALSFDGIDDYVQVPDDESLDLTTAITLEAWIKAPSGQTNGDRMVSKHRAYLIQYWNDRINAGVFTAAGWGGSGWLSTVSIFDDSWHHVALTYDGSYMRLYIDGELDTTKALTGNIVTNENDLSFGCRTPATDRFFTGTIDEVRIWDVALGPDAILQSYELGTAQTETCVVQLSHQVLSSSEVVCFTSAFYLGRQDPDTEKTVDIYIMSSSGDREIDEVGLRRVTPGKTDGDLDDVGGSGTDWWARVNNGTATWKGKTSTSIHLYAELDTDERLGVNAQYLPWD